MALGGIDRLAPTEPGPDSSATRPVAVVHILMLASGFCALVYQALWARSFTLVFGSTTRSASAVLGAFFLGMALGSWLAGRRARAAATAIRAYGIVEIAIAASSLCIPIWLAAYEHAYPQLYARAGDRSWLLTAAHLGLAWLAMGPPCIAMGATLPLVAGALARHPSVFGARVGATYALNTLGAMLGALAAGFLLVPSLGVARSLQLAAAINFLLGAVAIALSHRIGEVRAAAAAEPARVRAPTPLGPAAIAAASGFCVLSLEILYTRLLIARTDGSALSFAVILAAFLVWLAMAAFAVARWVGAVRHPWRVLTWSQGAAALTVIAAPVLFADIQPLSGAPSLSQSVLVAMIRSVAVIAPSILLAGVALPIAWTIAVRDGAPAAIAVGRLTSVNTLAGVAGAWATGFWLLPALGTSGATKTVAGIYALVAIGSAARAYPASRAAPIAIAIALAYLGLALSKLAPSVPVNTSDGGRVVYSYEGEMASVAVTETRSGASLWLNGYYLLGTGFPAAIPAQRVLGALPLLLHPDPKRVAFIGIATGVSVSAVLDFPVQRVLALELVPGVIEANAFFSEANRGVFSDPRVESKLADGRHHLFATRERFDVIVGDLFVLWHAGVGYMYTAEHFRNIADRLAPGGLFVQWLPGHNLSPEEIRMMTATFLSAFPEASLWVYRTRGDRPLLALVGAAALHPARAQSGPQWSAYPNLTPVCGTDVLRGWSAGARLNSDDLPLLEYMAARKHFGVVGRIGEVEQLVKRLDLEERRARGAPPERRDAAGD